LPETGLAEASATYANPLLRADLSTDDWPFFYMPRRVYPISYLAMVALVLVLSLALVAGFSDVHPRISHVPFFLLGVGFMLIETKGITELGLTFGNSWQVIAVVITGVMLMAFLANYFVQRWTIRRVSICYLLLLLSLFLGWFVAGHGGLPSRGGSCRYSCAADVSIFSPEWCFRRSYGQAYSGMMSANLFGAAAAAGVHSMYFGIRSLYLIAVGLYLGAFLWGLRPQKIEEMRRISVRSAE
jgi:hypothetical protein